MLWEATGAKAARKYDDEIDSRLLMDLVRYRCFFWFVDAKHYIQRSTEKIAQPIDI